MSDLLRRAAPLLLSLLCACSPGTATIKRGHDFSRVRRVALSGFGDLRNWPGSGALAAGAFERHLLAAEYAVLADRGAGVDALIEGRLTRFSPPRRRKFASARIDESRDPIVRRVTRRVRRPDGRWDLVSREEVVGHHLIRRQRRVPVVLTVEGEVSLAARMVDAETGEVLWSGSARGSGYALEDAADAAAEGILRAVKATWPKPAPAGRP